MYKAFIEPDLQTAHLKIINKFNPFSGFQNPTYILKVTLCYAIIVRFFIFSSVFLMMHCVDCFYHFSQQELWQLIKSRQLLLQSILKPKRKRMTYFFYPLGKTLKLVNHIWEWETVMESTISCLRLGDWKLFRLL